MMQLSEKGGGVSYSSIRPVMGSSTGTGGGEGREGEERGPQCGNHLEGPSEEYLVLTLTPQFSSRREKEKKNKKNRVGC